MSLFRGKTISIQRVRMSRVSEATDLDRYPQCFRFCHNHLESSGRMCGGGVRKELVVWCGHTGSTGTTLLSPVFQVVDKGFRITQDKEQKWGRETFGVQQAWGKRWSWSRLPSASPTGKSSLLRSSMAPDRRWLLLWSSLSSHPWGQCLKALFTCLPAIQESWTWVPLISMPSFSTESAREKVNLEVISLY